MFGGNGLPYARHAYGNPPGSNADHVRMGIRPVFTCGLLEDMPCSATGSRRVLSFIRQRRTCRLRQQSCVCVDLGDGLAKESTPHNSWYRPALCLRQWAPSRSMIVHITSYNTRDFWRPGEQRRRLIGVRFPNWVEQRKQILRFLIGIFNFCIE